MPPDTIQSIEAEIADLRDKISKAEEQQAFTSGGPGAGSHIQRGDLRSMYNRLLRLEERRDRLYDALNGGQANRVVFRRPRGEIC